ncbi:MAG: hypothetical protein LUD39_03610, partial [Opitutae bacterium]|nr:hypothetical protein [Opitutae bacterium]
MRHKCAPYYHVSTRITSRDNGQTHSFSPDISAIQESDGSAKSNQNAALMRTRLSAGRRWGG